MFASLRRKSAQSFGLENVRQIFTLHTQNSEQNGSRGPFPSTASAKFPHRIVGVFPPF
jgi:hypothetical protein